MTISKTVSLTFNKIASAATVTAMVVSLFPAGFAGFNFALASDSLFSDSFDQSGSSLTNGWEVINDSPSRTGTNAIVNKALNFKGGSGSDDSAQREISTHGYSSLNVSYKVRTSSLDSGETFTAQYYLDGTLIDSDSWTGSAANFVDVSFVQSNSNRNTKLTIRFTISADHSSDIVGVEDLVVTGDGAPLFYDGFESGNFTAGGWTTVDSPTVRDSDDIPIWTDDNDSDDGHAVELEGGSPSESITKAFSTSGYQDIHVRYAREVNDELGGSENLQISYSNDGGSTWQPALESVGSDTDFASVKFGPLSGANNNPNFRIRIIINANDDEERAYVDDVVIWGDEAIVNGTLEVVKEIVGGDEGDDPEDFSFEVTAGEDSVLEGQEFEEDGQNDLLLAPDTYTVTEEAVDGWVTTYDNCSDVALALGETETCTITNTKLGSITIKKVTVPGEVDQDFTFTAEGLPDESQFTLNTAEVDEVTFSQLESGEYTFTETEVENYVTSVSCEADGADVTAGTNSVTIDLDVTEDVVCTFTNKRLPMLTIYKYASPLDSSFDIAVNAPGEENDSVFTAEVAGDGEANSGSDYHYVALGEYTLTETLPEGWGANGTGGVSSSVCYTNGDDSPMSGTSITTTLAYGDVVNCIFNNTPNSIIAGDKFEDLDGKGESTDGDGLSGWTIRLFSWDGDSWDFEDDTTTDAGGMFNFGNIQPGTYLLCEEEQSSWYQSVPTTGTVAPQGAVVTDCINDNYPWLSAKGYELEIVEVPVETVEGEEGEVAAPLEDDQEFPGQVFDGFRFGNYQKGSIGGLKWHDTDANGVLCTEDMAAGELCDEESAPNSNWYISYSGPYNNGGEWTSAGTFSFTNLEPGTYTLSETMQEGWVQTYPGNESGTHSVVVQSGDHKIRNFGNVEDSVISGYKWNDLNADGEWQQSCEVQDCEVEPVLADFHFKLLKHEGESVTEVGTATSNGSGYYEFSGLLPGTYSVIEVGESHEDDWQQTYPAEEAGHTVTIGINDESEDNNFGNTVVKSVFGYKFHDMDRDGYWDGVHGESYEYEEPGLVGWTITATPVKWACEGEEENCAWVTDDSRTAKTTVTDEDGKYGLEFFGDDLGTWWKITETLQNYWSQTFPGTNDYVVKINDDGYDVAEGYPGPSSHGYGSYFDFGNWKWPVIELFKWSDANSDGQQDEGEEPVEGYQMAIGRAVNSEPGENEGQQIIQTEILAMQLTGSNGIASFPVNPDWFGGLDAIPLEMQQLQLMGLETVQSDWTMTYPDFLHNNTINIVPPPSVPLHVESFFDIFVELNDPWQPTTQGRQHDSLNEPTLPLRFGNHFTAPVSPSPSPTPPPSGGGNGPIVGSIPQGQVLGASTVPNGQVLGASTESCSAYINTFMRFGGNNDMEQVKRLQGVLVLEGFEVTVSGTFDKATEEAVKGFQKKYASEILTPWGITEPTGFVYLTTRKKLNELHCKATGETFPLSADEKKIIDGFKNPSTGSGQAVSPPPAPTPNPVPENIGSQGSDTVDPNVDNGSQPGAAAESTGGFWSLIKKLFGN